MNGRIPPPTGAFVAASWLAMVCGALAYLIGLWRSSMQLNEQGYYFAVLLLGLYAAISLQKTVRDRLDGIAVTPLYFALSWMALGASVVLIVVGLFNATLADSEKGFYAMSFILALFGAVAVQKNTRDLSLVKAADTTVLPEQQS